MKVYGPVYLNEDGEQVERWVEGSTRVAYCAEHGDMKAYGRTPEEAKSELNFMLDEAA